MLSLSVTSMLLVQQYSMSVVLTMGDFIVTDKTKNFVSFKS